MEPRTIFQCRVVDLSKRLSPITKEQKEWAVKTMSGNYAVVSRNRTFCLECGHKWNEGIRLVELAGDCVCPNCKTKLTYNSNRNIKYEATYFSIVTTLGEFQVVRMFLFNQAFVKNQKSTYHIDEVMQHYIDAEGKRETLSKPTNNMTYEIDQWSYGKLEVRTNSERHYMRFLIKPCHTFPEKYVLPIIERNGFSGYIGKLSPQEVFLLLLTDNRAETLYKTGQLSVFDYYKDRANSISRYWRSIQICTRHSYVIPDAVTWFDYLDLLIYFRKDTSNPKFICPDSLKKAHNELLQKKNKIVEEERRIASEERRIKEELENKEIQKQFIKMKSKFFGLVFHSGNITINTLSSISEFKEEADQLKHCVYSNEYFKKEDSLIMSAKIEGKPIETIEISLKDYKIIQSRGLQNKASEHHDKILDIVQKNISQIVKAKEVVHTKKSA